MIIFKTILFSFFIFLSVDSFAELSKKNTRKLTKICIRENPLYQKAEKICACEAENFKWLLGGDNWKMFLERYQYKGTGNSETEAMDNMIYEVTTGCYKKRSYLAPKAKRLRAASQNKKL